MAYINAVTFFCHPNRPQGTNTGGLFGLAWVELPPRAKSYCPGKTWEKQRTTKETHRTNRGNLGKTKEDIETHKKNLGNLGSTKGNQGKTKETLGKPRVLIPGN